MSCFWAVLGIFFRVGFGVFVFLLNSCVPFPRGQPPDADFSAIPSPGTYINLAYYVDCAHSTLSYPVVSDVKKPHF